MVWEKQEQATNETDFFFSGGSLRLHDAFYCVITGAF